ncbi:MAG: DUF6491 family protein [Woeseiaceae bacterium]|nr:DUF6491 family protein [Woeseiaceae bacterium]
MRTLLLLFVLILVGACAGQSTKLENQNTAIRDLIEVNELEEVDVVRFVRQLDAYEINAYYLILSERKKKYLLEYRQRCARDFLGRVEPDVRYEAKAIRPKIDTFRGCRIHAIYAIDDALEGELKQIGKAPGEK